MAYVQRKSNNKYHAKGRRYNGQWFDSTGEMNYAQQLDFRIKAKDIKSYTRQVKIDLRVNDTHIVNYYCDFRIVHNDDSIEYTEYKGAVTEVFTIKWRLFTALISTIDPGAKLTIVKHQ